MSNWCLKASLIDGITLLRGDNSEDRTIGKHCDSDNSSENAGTRHALWILHRTVQTRPVHSEAPFCLALRRFGCGYAAT
jgi:hypothetical protein